MKLKNLVITLALLLTNSFALYAQQFDSEKNIKSYDFKDEDGNSLIMKRNSQIDTLETDAFQQRLLNGYAASDNFGISVTGAGDVNGDGYEDIIAGAPFNDFSATEGGRAYIYFGGAVFNSTPDVIFSGTFPSGWLGFSVASAGDVNGDGYDDVIIGVMGYASFTGRVYIYYGGASMNTIADVTLTGETIGDEFGRAVAGADDLNGDGFSDVIVGAPANNSSTGKSYVFFGGAAMNSTADLTMPGQGTGYAFGYCVSSAGDMNGDGFADVIVGSPYAFTNIGRGYLFFGGTSMDSVIDVVFFGSGSNSQFGTSLANAGDVNNDGYSDLAAGAPGYSSSTGRVYVYYGSSSPNATADVTITGEAAGNSLGFSVCSIGDINGDSYSDIAAGSPNHNSLTGRVYVFKGGVTMDNSADKYFSGENSSDNFGYAVGNCGDVNGDGYSEIIAGAYNNDINGSNSGRAYVYFDKMTGTDLRDFTLTEGTASESFGNSISSAGDVNGDGFDDIIVGNYKYNSNTGRAYIYYGGAIMNTTADVILTGELPAIDFGSSVSSAGDVNSDGYDDVIVGAPNHNSSTGRAYIYFGGSSMNNTADVILSGVDAADDFGTRVNKANDVNGDGYGDVIVSATYAGGGSSIGRVYLYLGGSAMNNVFDLEYNEFTTTGGSFGISISSTDFNTDGYSDVIIGSPSGDASNGIVYVYYGDEVLDKFADIFLYGTGAMGSSLLGSFDFNGDNADDIAATNGAPGSRTVKIFYGEPYPDAESDFIINTPEVLNNYFGSSLSAASDLNSDGYNDILICDTDFGSLDFGIGYVYFGGPMADVNYDMFFIGDTTSFRLNNLVSAGDINNDGITDLMYGSGGNTRANVYISSPPEVNPMISYYKDIPFDQGGRILLKWNKSAYDVSGGHVISYTIERSTPPGISGFSWEQTGTISSIGIANYSFTANTLNDSMSGNSGTTYFRITAMSSDPYVSWKSNIVSAYSVDNLAPYAPQNLTASAAGSLVNLDWDQNIEADFHHYNIYRNTAFIATSIISNYPDNSITGDSLYVYQISAVDIHGNISTMSDTANVLINNSGTLNITMVMEGYYIPSLNRMTTGDTVKVNLRNETFPYAIIETAISITDYATFICSFEILNAVTGNYYLEIEHRNTISTWSAAPVSYVTGSTVNYDFAYSLSQAFGNNMIQVDMSPLTFAIYSGDVNKDGIVDGTDGVLIDNDAANFNSGYLSTDLNGDEITDGSDAVIADNNAANFVAAVVP